MNHRAKFRPLLPHRRESGQALVEYALILVLVSMALVAALIATGPAIGNVFSNTVCNLVGQTDCNPADISVQGNPAAFWQTVTAVALNPPANKPLPTVPTRPPTSTWTPGPSPTPTPKTPTATPVPTETKAPTATPTDAGFLAPFVDPIDHPEWWRVDSSVYLGGEDWQGSYYANKTLSGTPEVKWNKELGPDYEYTIAFDWGAGSPIIGFQADDFSVRWARRIYVPGTVNITVQATITSLGGYRFFVDNPSTPLIQDWNENRNFNSPPGVATFTLTPGTHWLYLDYLHGKGNAAIFLQLDQYRPQVLGDVGACQWTRIQGSQPNTVAWAWKESAPGTGSGFPPNTTCSLELRGWVDVSAPGLTNPQMSFWDVWDFGGATDTSVQLQIAEYQPYVYLANGTIDPASGPDWTNSQKYTLRTGSRNYAWTRSIVPVPNVPSKKITYRFLLKSGGATGQTRRWYLDDIRIDNQPTRPQPFTVCSGSQATCGNYWDLENPAQKNDFITSGRWDLTNRYTADNSALAWDATGTTAVNTYERFGPEQPGSSPGHLRQHTIEFNGEVDLRSALPDWEGNEGDPLLVFYHAREINSGSTLELQYSTSPRGTAAETWTTFWSINGESRNLAMQREEVPLNFPGWNAGPFRLRFALTVSNGTPSFKGWFIDNIAFARRGVPRFSAYPFCDDAESGNINWLMSGQWGLATVGVFNSSRSFSDSPTGNYTHGLNTWMEMRYPIDFNNDTPENLAEWGGNQNCLGGAGGPAVEPILTFWHLRDLANAERLTVDVRRAAHTPSSTTGINWTTVWSYDYNTATNIQQAWEYVEINLRATLERATGVTWATLTNPANSKYDDDFYIRFRLDATTNTSVSDGVYIDNIDIRNLNEVTHKLWNSSLNHPTFGRGDSPRYLDQIDPPQWWTRWRAGGSWGSTGDWPADIPVPYWWRARSGSAALTDSPPLTGTYKRGEYSILELDRIIDMRATTTADEPILYFWHHYNLGSNATIRVQVAVENPARNGLALPLRHEFLNGWGPSDTTQPSWQTIWPPSGGGSITGRVDTWVRQAVDLKSFVGRRIRLRFVLDAYKANSPFVDGWYIDDVRIEFRDPTIIPLPFFDAAQNMSNWIGEGIWNLAPDYWKGSGGGPAALGPDRWKQYFFKCVTNFTVLGNGDVIGGTLNTCDQSSHITSRINPWLAAVAPTVDAMNRYVVNNPGKALPMLEVNEINNDFGTTGRPPGAPPGPAGSAWEDNMMGRWIRTISVQAGDYTFVTTSDDGVRVRYRPSGPEPRWPTNWNQPSTWNIIYNWNHHGRTVDIKTISLDTGDYDIVVEWFEGYGGAVIIAQVGNNNFSFSDSPKASLGSEAVPTINYGNSSLLLNGVLNLNRPTGVTEAQWRPILQYYTLYDLPASSALRAEISIDGGVTWTQQYLNNWNTYPLTCPHSVACSCPSGASCDPYIGGASTRLPPYYDWQWRYHNLRAYANRPGNINFIGLRFRLSTQNVSKDGVWITEIQVNNP